MLNAIPAIPVVSICSSVSPCCTGSPTVSMVNSVATPSSPTVSMRTVALLDSVTTSSATWLAPPKNVP